MKQVVIAFLVCLLLFKEGQSQSCTNLPEKFYSYTEAINAIQKASFKTIDQLPFGKSAWIKSANYYSCDGNYGYLLYSTDKSKGYIHENVPIRIWIELKNASSSGSYYVGNIKGRYGLVPE